jgi:hypothetical protein
MSREVHVQFCERVGVKLPCATHRVVTCRTRKEAEKAMTDARKVLATLGVTLNEQKTESCISHKGSSF